MLVDDCLMRRLDVHRRYWTLLLGFSRIYCIVNWLAVMSSHLRLIFVQMMIAKAMFPKILSIY